MKINRRQKKRIPGFTLIEMLLVLVIISMIIVMGSNYLQQRTLQLRIDRATGQIQQILNAGLAYYVVNASWPTNLGTLQTNGAYLPPNTPNTGQLFSPWNTTYIVATSSSAPSSLFYVYFEVSYGSSSTSAPMVANMIAGRLPLSYTTTSAPAAAGEPPPDDGSCKIGDTAQSCYVVAAVNIPGQNLNNATAVNFAGVYHSGACVPAPTCPVDQAGLPMQPEIIVVPVSVTGVYANNGVNDGVDQPVNSGGTCDATHIQNCAANVYPLSSFTARAVGNGTTSAPVQLSGGKGPQSCDGLVPTDTCLSSSSGATLSGTGYYWRVCLSTITEKGPVTIPPSGPVSKQWGQLQGSVMAITRCVPQGQNTGSGFDVWAR